MRRKLTGLAPVLGAMLALGATQAAGQDAPVAAIATHSAAQAFQIARAGDTQLSCEALQGEIRSLENELEAMQAEHDALIASTRQRGRVTPEQRAAAFANAAGGAAVPGAGMAVAAASHQAANAAANARRQSSNDLIARSVMAQGERKEQRIGRMSYLMQVSAQKHCPAGPIMSDARGD